MQQGPPALGWPGVIHPRADALHFPADLAGSRVAGEVDYTLARNAVLREFRKGRLSRLDVCDAHPDLLRAALNVGTPIAEECPICAATNLRLVSYVFGSRLPPSGTCVSSPRELARLSRTARDLACYVVEVCPACAWNHLSRSFAVSTRR